MMLSELIEKLQNLYQKSGDVECVDIDFNKIGGAYHDEKDDVIRIW